MPLGYGCGGGAEIAAYVGQMAQHFGKTHVGHLAVMNQGSVARFCSHQVAAKESKLRSGCVPAQLRYQSGGMYVA